MAAGWWQLSEEGGRTQPLRVPPKCKELQRRGDRHSAGVAGRQKKASGRRRRSDPGRHGTSVTATGFAVLGQARPACVGPTKRRKFLEAWYQTRSRADSRSEQSRRRSLVTGRDRVSAEGGRSGARRRPTPNCWGCPELASSIERASS